MAYLAALALAFAALVQVCTAQTIADIVNQRAELSELESLLENSALGSGLGDRRISYTFFAPNNEAIRRMPEEARALLRDAAKRDRVLSYHFVPQGSRSTPYRTADFADKRVQTLTVDSPKLFLRSFSVGGVESYYVNGAKVVTGDLQASNGIVHIISDVLYPVGSKKNALAFVVDSSQTSDQRRRTKMFSDLLNVLQWQLPFQNLNSDDMFVTAFVPSDAVLRKLLDNRNGRDLLADPQALLKLVNRHIIVGERTAGNQDRGVEAVWHSKLLNAFIDNNLASGATRGASIPAMEGAIKPIRVGRTLYVTNECGMVKVANLPRRRRWNQNGRNFNNNNNNNNNDYDNNNNDDGDDDNNNNNEYPEYDSFNDRDSGLTSSQTETIPDNTVNNGVVHIVDGLLGYIYRDAMGLLDQSDDISMFRDRLRMSDQFVQRLTVAPNIQVPENNKYTIFAPINRAFEMMEQKSNIDLTQNQTLRNMVLNMHMLPGMISIADITNRTRKGTLQSGVAARFIADRTGTYVIVENIKARIVQADSCVRNGIVHYIDNLLGVPFRNLYDEIESEDRLLALFEAVKNTPTFVENPSRDRPLKDILKERYARRTVFAPNNFAFNRMQESAIGRSYMDSINADKLYYLMLRHMPEGEYYIGDTFSGEERVRNSDQLYITREGEDYFVEYRSEYGTVRAKIIERNIRQTNGVTHIIDAVLYVNNEQAFNTISGAATCTQAVLLVVALFLLQFSFH